MSAVFKVTSSVHCLAGAICSGGIPTQGQRFELEQARIALDLILSGEAGDDPSAFAARVYDLAYEKCYRRVA